LLADRIADAQLQESRLEELQSRIEALATKIAVYETQLEGCTIRATSQGIVVYGTVFDKQTGQRQVMIGDLVWSNVVILQVTDLNQVDLLVKIPEEQMHDFTEGLDAVIWMTAEPLKALSGKVRSIGSMAGESGMSSQFQKTVTVRIGLDAPPSWIRPAMTGKTSITVCSFSDVLVIPYSSVGFDDTESFVMKKRFWGVRRQPVEIIGSVEQGIVAGRGLERSDKILREIKR